MDINALNLGITIGGLVLANWGVKLGRALPIVTNAYNLIKNQEEARKDGKLTDKEKSGLYDDIEGLLKEAYSIIKGWTFFKSKV